MIKKLETDILIILNFRHALKKTYVPFFLKNLWNVLNNDT